MDSLKLRWEHESILGAEFLQERTAAATTPSADSGSVTSLVGPLPGESGGDCWHHLKKKKKETEVAPSLYLCQPSKFS